MKKFIILFSFILNSINLKAEDLRVFGLFGVGNSSVSSSDTNLTEAPLAFSVGVEDVFFRNLSGALDHAHGIGLTPISFATSFTGLSFKYYYFGMVSSPVFDSEDNSFNHFSYNGWLSYLGLGFGLAVAQLGASTDSASNTNQSKSGIYYTTKLGFEKPYWKKSGFRAELSLYSTFMGDYFISGQALFGLFWWI